jgi:signal transduction histidine kinase
MVMESVAAGRGRGVAKSSRPFALAGLTLAAVATTALVAVAPMRVAYDSPSLHTVVETAAAVIALLVAALAFGRYRERPNRVELLLSGAFLLFGTANLLFGALARALVLDDAFSAWAAASARLVAAALLCAAAFVPARRLERVRLAQWTTLGVIAVLFTAIVALTRAFEHQLPAAVRPGGSATAPGTPHLTAHPLLLACLLASFALHAAAALGFHRRGRAGQDLLLGGLAIASAVGALSTLNYVLYPSLYSDWVCTGDLLRLLFYLAVLVTASAEVRRYWRERVERGVLLERQRVARELHDGLAQELALIRRSVYRLDQSDPVVRRLAAASERALHESRHAITALSEWPDEPLHTVLERAAEEVTDDQGPSVAVDADPRLRAAPAQREALVRIVREGVVNAARHGGARHVAVELRAAEGHSDRLRLRLADDGDGFDPAERAYGGFGLESMRQRAEALGGTFRLVSGRGQGTTIEALL